MNRCYAPALISLVASSACSSPEDIGVDAFSSPDAAITIDAEPPPPPPCTTDGKIYVAQAFGTEVEVFTIDDVLAGTTDFAEVTCPAEPTALGVLLDGSAFVAMKGGGIARLSPAGCTAITVAPALTGDLGLVGVGDALLALGRSDGGLWLIDPATGAATRVGTVAGVTATSSLVGGSQGAMVYVPAPLIGTGSLIALDAQFQPRPPTTISGGSSTQAQADWVGVVAHEDELWMTTSGYYGAGGGRRTMWIPVEDHKISAAAYAYYAQTVAVSAATCPL